MLTTFEYAFLPPPKSRLKEGVTKFYECHNPRSKHTKSVEQLPPIPESPVEFATKTLAFPADDHQQDLLNTTSRRVIVCCCRQWGKSTTAAIKALHHALRTPDSLTLIASRTRRQAGETLEKATNFASRLGLRIRRAPRHPDSLLLPNGARIIALPGKPDSLRGFSAVSLLIVDEAAYVADELYHALRPMLATSGGALWLLSTPRGRAGFFYDEWSAITNIWTKFTVTADNCPRIDPAFLEEERRLHGPALFRREYHCDFGSSGRCFFDIDGYDAAINDPGRHEYGENFAAVRPTTRFLVGFDVGQRSTPAAIVALEVVKGKTGRHDPVTFEQLEETRFLIRRVERLPLNTPFDSLATMLNRMLRDLGDPKYITVWVDATGVGQPFIEILRRQRGGALINGVAITASGPGSYSSGVERVSKTALMANANFILSKDCLSAQPGMAGLKELREEMEAYRLKTSRAGTDTFRTSHSDDLQFWLDYFARIKSDAVCLSAGGVVAFYPTKITLHHRSNQLGNTDPFGDLVAGCRKLAMVVIARTDPHAIHQNAAGSYPEWIAIDAQGQKRKHWADPSLWITCALGPYNFDFMTEVTREIMRMYQVDGIFTNRWSGSGMCYCNTCQKLFQADSGMELPRTNDPLDPARRNYILWREKRLFELWRLWDGEIRKINPNARYIANAGGGALSNLDMKTIGELAPTLFADRQARRGLMAPWENGKNGKEYRATLGRKAIVGIFSVGVEEPYRWKDSVQSDAEIRIWVADGVANDLRPWFTKFAGHIYDKRWLKTVEDLYLRYAQWEPYLRNEEAIARVGLVYSQQTATYYGGDKATEKVEDPTLGIYQALLEARIPFEMVHDRLLDAAHLDRYRLLILPNVAALSDAQCRQLNAFVERGGGLVATHETSLHDEWGKHRSNFGLASLFGVNAAGPSDGPMRNAYLTLEHATAKGHPLLRGLEDAPRIIHGTQRIPVTPDPAVRFEGRPLTLIPSYPDLPMEMVYPRVEHTDTAEVFLRQVGKGRIVYFPWDIDRTFWEVLSSDHGKLLRNAFEWALNEEQSVSVEGQGFFDITAWKQKQSMTVHLVNLTNPMLMKGPYRELIPSPSQRVRIKLPAGAKPRKVKLLASGQVPKSRLAAGWLEVTVPSVLDHEIVAIDL